MKRYTFNLVIREGIEDFWKAIHGVSGVTEIQGAVENALALGGFDSSTYDVSITHFEDTNTVTVFDEEPHKAKTIELPKVLYDSVILALEDTLSQSFDCDCDVYQDKDTGAWIHDENICWDVMEDHIRATLEELHKLMGESNDDA